MLLLGPSPQVLRAEARPIHSTCPSPPHERRRWRTCAWAACSRPPASASTSAARRCWWPASLPPSPFTPSTGARGRAGLGAGLGGGLEVPAGCYCRRSSWAGHASPKVHSAGELSTPPLDALGLSAGSARRGCRPLLMSPLPSGGALSPFGDLCTAVLPAIRLGLMCSLEHRPVFPPLAYLSPCSSVPTSPTCCRAGYIDVGIAGGVEHMTVNPLEWEGSTSPRIQEVEPAKDVLLPLGERLQPRLLLAAVWSRCTGCTHKERPLP